MTWRIKNDTNGQFKRSSVPAIVRFIRKTEQVGECILWRGAVGSKTGYGLWAVRKVRADHKKDWHRKTHCIKGHEFTSENTRIKPRKSGGSDRICRICQRAWKKANWDKYPRDRSKEKFRKRELRRLRKLSACNPTQSTL
jgi:hypothetical protein